MDRFEIAEGVEQVTFSYVRVNACRARYALKVRYHPAHFALLSRALHQSIRIALMVEDTGYLSVQVMMPVSDKEALGEHEGILEFKVSQGGGASSVQANEIDECTRRLRVTKANIVYRGIRCSVRRKAKEGISISM